MLFNHQGRQYHEAVSSEGNAGGSGGEHAVKTPADIQSLIDSKVSEAVTGLKAKNSELLGKLNAEKENLKRFEGIDPDAVRTILQRFSDDEEAKLIAEGKIDQVLDKRTERLRQSAEKEVKTAQEKVEKSQSMLNKYRDRVLNDAIRSAALKTSPLPSADEDILLRAKALFTLNDDGEAVAVDRDGHALLGKDGRTPLLLDEWLASLKETAPHLWPDAQGTGAGGSRKTGVHSFKRSHMTAQQKAEYIREHGQKAFLTLPKE